VKNVDGTEVQLIKELRQRIAELENFPEPGIDSAVEIYLVMYVQGLNPAARWLLRRMLN
jgi:hypothetical protein